MAFSTVNGLGIFSFGMTKKCFHFSQACFGRTRFWIFCQPLPVLTAFVLWARKIPHTVFLLPKQASGSTKLFLSSLMKNIQSVSGRDICTLFCVKGTLYNKWLVEI